MTPNRATSDVPAAPALTPAGPEPAATAPTSELPLGEIEQDAEPPARAEALSLGAAAPNGSPDEGEVPAGTAVALDGRAQVVADTLQRLDEMLAAGRSVVVDNTNPTAAERVQIITAAKARGARVIGYFFNVSTRAAVARNANRTGRSKVPNVAIFTTAKRLQPPKLAEGFV